MILPARQRITYYCTSAALLFFMLSCCVVAMSVTLMIITYLSAFLFIVLSGEWQTRWAFIKNNPAAWSFWLIGLLFVCGSFYATSTHQLIIHDLQKRHWLLITPLLMSVLKQSHWRRRMVNAFLCAVVITVCFSYLQSLLGFRFESLLHIKTERTVIDIHSVFQNHIIQSIVMNIGAFICGYRFLFEKRGSVFYLSFFMLLGVNILFMTHDRTGYGIFLLILLYLGALRFGLKGLFIASVLFCIAVAGAFYFSQGFQDRIKPVYAYLTHQKKMPIEKSLLQRTEMWGIAKKMIAERPWFGYGTGGIRTALPSVVPLSQRTLDPQIDYVESIYLNFLLEFGIVGLAVFLIAIAIQIKISFSLSHEYRALMHLILIIILIGGLCNAFLVSSPIAHLYSLFSAICFSEYQKNNWRARYEIR